MAKNLKLTIPDFVDEEYLRDMRDEVMRSTGMSYEQIYGTGGSELDPTVPAKGFQSMAETQGNFVQQTLS